MDPGLNILKKKIWDKEYPVTLTKYVKLYPEQIWILNFDCNRVGSGKGKVSIISYSVQLWFGPKKHLLYFEIAQLLYQALCFNKMYLCANRLLRS